MTNVAEDLSPSDGKYFQPSEPPEREISRKKEQTEVISAMPAIKAEVERLKKRIAYRDSVDSIEVLIEDDPALHQKTFLVNKAVKAELEEELRLLEDKVSEYDQLSR